MIYSARAANFPDGQMDMGQLTGRGHWCEITIQVQTGALLKEKRKKREEIGPLTGVQSGPRKYKHL